MTIITDAPPTRRTPVAHAWGFLTGGVIGTSPAALVVGGVTERWPLFVTGWVLPAVYGLLFFLAGRPRRAREAAIAPHTALALIESLKAIGSESSDVPVRFDLTVAPDDAPAYRVEITQDINLADLPDYRPRGVGARRGCGRALTPARRTGPKGGVPTRRSSGRWPGRPAGG